jgi:hypothetical protein
MRLAIEVGESAEVKREEKVILKHGDTISHILLEMISILLRGNAHEMVGVDMNNRTVDNEEDLSNPSSKGDLKPSVSLYSNPLSCSL